MLTSVTYICSVQMYTMVNTAKITERLEKILQEYGLSAASFAQKINVGRATISHILSGRNKPSLDFILKVIAAFPEVDLYWLLLGQGNFKKNAITNSPVSSLDTFLEKQNHLEKEEKISKTINAATASTPKMIKKIVIFYQNNTFESYEN